MATTKQVQKTPSGRLTYRGVTFSGYNKPKRTPNERKKKRGFGSKRRQN